MSDRIVFWVCFMLSVGFYTSAIYDLGYRTAQADCKPRIATEIKPMKYPQGRDVQRFANYYRRSL